MLVFNKTTWIFCCLLIIQSAISQPLQRCQHTIYNSKNGLTNQVVKSITEDENGFLWLMSDYRLQWFDGSSFHPIPFGNSNHRLPGILFHTLQKTSNNEIWIFYDKSFSVYNSKTHSFYHNPYQLPVDQTRALVPVAQQKDEFIFCNGNRLLYISKQTKKITKTCYIKNGINPFYLNNISGNNQVITSDGIFFYAYNLSSGSSKKINLPPGNEYYPFQMLNDSLYMAFSSESVSLFRINDNHPVKTVRYPAGKSLTSFFKPQDICFKNKETLLLIAENELWEFNITLFRFVRKFANLQGQDFFSNGYFKTTFYSTHGILWAGSNLNGLFRINLQAAPVFLYATQNENENFIKSFFVNKKKNIVVCGTYNSGIVIYDTAGAVIKKYPLREPGELNGALINSVKQINNDYAMVLLYGKGRHFKLNLNTLELSPLTILNEKGQPYLLAPGYYLEPVPLENEQFYMPGKGYRIILKFKNHSFIVSPATDSEIKNFNWPSLIPVKLQNLYYYTGTRYFDHCLQKTGLQEAGAVCLAQKGNNWLIATIKGIYEFDAKENLIHSYNISTGLPDEHIYAVIPDNEGNVWCSHDKGLSKISSNGRVLNFSKEDGLQEDEFNYAAAAKTEDGHLFFGGIKGLNTFHPDHLKKDLDTPQLVITKISTGANDLPTDTSFWNINQLSLAYNNNRIKINFSAAGTVVSEAYNYQYRIIGLGKEWKNLKHEQEVNLALPPGRYELQLAASGVFLANAAPQKKISIYISAPFYMRWWFMILYIFMLIMLTWYTIHYINQRKFRSRQQLSELQEQLENERQRISRDLHDNMGAYTSALLSNVEKLKVQVGENGDLAKMKSNAEQILNSLRETIWVLNNKEISITDFSDEFKTYCLKIFRNFDHIHFEASEEIKDNKMLAASVAIHLNKILQEIIQNIIKHSRASVIQFHISSSSSLVLLTLSDNGLGFNTTTAVKGNGLENISWRAKEAGLNISISSSPNKGTSFAISKEII